MASRVLFSSRRLSLVLEIAPRISFAPPKVVPFLQPRSHFSDKPREEPSDKVKELTDQILSLNFLEVNQLLLRLQDRLGVSDDFLMQAGMGGGGGGGAPAAAASTAAPEPVKEKESFDLKMTSIDQKAKIKIIKEIRTITGLGLKEAKEMVEKAPVVVKNGLPKAEAEQLAKVLKEAGAEVELV